MAVEVTGLKVVVEGAAQATRALQSYDKAVASVQKSQGALASRLGGKSLTGDITKGFEALRNAGAKTSSTFDSLKTTLPQINQALSAFTQATGVSVPVLGQAGAAAGSVSKAFATIPPPALAAAGAIVALTAGFTAFLSLGARGAALQPTINAFGNLASQFGDSTLLLNRLREQTQGTISDLQLMRTATFALSGASKELGNVLSQDLGNILNNTRRLAEALGRDPAEAQGRFIEAIKKNERELLDELGIIVGADAAYKSYAASIGKAATALTDQEKNTAFAIAAIEQLDAKVKTLGDQSSTLSNLTVPFTVIQNILDKLALAVQPLFGPLVAGVAGFFRGLESGANLVIPVIASFASTMASILGVIGTVGQLLAVLVYQFTPLGIALQFVGSIAPYVAAAFQILASAVASVANAVSNAIASVIPQLGGFENDTQSTVERIAFNLSRGGTFIIGSFAAGLLNGGKLVIQAVTKIAQIVADFLQGFSPPKKGPLAQIDKGGENVAKAWADGLLSGFANSAQQAAAFVTKELGDIARLSAKEVQAQFSKLDIALAPFNEQLTIAKGIFEQISGVAEPALKVLNRQIEEAFKAGDLARVQGLDKQAASLKALKSEQQAQLDNAELALALAKAQQAQERALLTVQQARVGKAKEAGNAGVGAIEKQTDALEKAKKEAAGSGQAPVTEAPAGGFTGGKAPDVLGNEAIDKAKAVLTGGFQEGLAGSGFNEALASFTEQSGQLANEVNRIKSAKPGDSIKKALDPVKQAGTDLQNSLKKVQETVSVALSTIGEAFTNILGSEGVQNILSAVTTAIDKLGTSISTLSSTVPGQLSSIGNSITDSLGISSQAKKGTDGISDSVGKIGTSLTNVVSPAKTALDQLNTLFNASFGEDGVIALGLNALVAEDGLFGKNGLLVTGINAIFGDKGIIAIGIPFVESLFAGLGTNIESSMNAVGSKLAVAVVTFTNFKTNVSKIIADLLLEFTNFSGGITNALSGLGTVLTKSFVDPFLASVNSVLTALEDAINSIIDELGVAADLAGLTKVNFPQIKVPGAEKGGLGLRGMHLVGERGPELVNFGNPANVFPASLTSAILGLEDSMRTVYAPAGGGGGGGGTNNATTNISSTFNVGSANQGRLLERQRLAFMGV